MSKNFLTIVMAILFGKKQTEKGKLLVHYIQMVT